MEGLFPKAPIAARFDATVPKCSQCGLFRKCRSPKMPPTGEGRKKILIVAEAPGRTEDEEGVQLIGESGQLLRRHLKAVGVDLDRDCWKTNSCICRSEGPPKDVQIQACRPNVFKAIREFKPRIIILLGASAVKSVVGPYWDRPEDSVGALSRWVGWQIPSKPLNAWICPTYHPAYVLRTNEDPALVLWWRRHLRRAVRLKQRPWVWDEIPDYLGSIRCLLDANEAARQVREFTQAGGPCAFDYETNMLKPDSSDARIVSCSVCWRGKTTIAFPWSGAVVPAMSEFLRSDRVQLIASNLKFEERWTRAVLGHRVRRWEGDTMLASHVLDNRTGITSIKFQAFVQLGEPPWDAAVSSFLSSDNQVRGENSPNHIDEVPIETLLIYNGLDSLMEYLVWQKQKEMLYAVSDFD